ncbi:MAG: hypothetical protein CO093_05395 [Alphaproteobacteria bacterium CG_4_9_14_3_um_filter_47_13]|nr:MAG: hypothetical protein CO093_05395 [Alphaproteobacteria bacterium CG_4_9_14_3_um_filter_47_13]
MDEEKKEVPKSTYEDSLLDAFIIASNVRNYTRKAPLDSAKINGAGFLAGGLAVLALSGLPPFQVAVGFIALNATPFVNLFKRRNNMVSLRKDFMEATESFDKHAFRFVKDMANEIKKIHLLHGPAHGPKDEIDFDLRTSWKEEPAATVLKLMIGIVLPMAAWASIVNDLDHNRLKRLNGMSNAALEEIREARPDIAKKAEALMAGKPEM